MQTTDIDLNRQVQAQCEYPGHTMMIALSIMLNFETLADAERTGSTFSEASECGAVPGAGDAVSTALRELQYGVREALDADQMAGRLDQCWADLAGHQPGFCERVEPGRAKAKPFEGEFKGRWPTWKALSRERAAEKV